VIAYKFLDAHGRGRFTGTSWPTPRGDQPGAWVDAGGPVAPCIRGVHAMRAEHVPFWLDQQLWEVELDGALVETDSLLVAQRGRLSRRVGAWDDDAWKALCEFCRKRTAAHLARVEVHAPSEVERARYFVHEVDAFIALAALPTAIYVAAVAAHVGSSDAPDLAYRAERKAQARFLSAHLGLVG
jgi:hypothetical protein